MPGHSGKMFNPLLVGKIIQYAQGSEARQEFLRDQLPELCLQQSLMFDSHFWDKLEEIYTLGDTQLCSHILKVIKMISIIDLDILLRHSLQSDELRVEIFEILIEGVQKKTINGQATKITDYTTEMIKLLLDTDDDKVRFRILYSVAALTEILPQSEISSTLQPIWDFIANNGDESRILQILMFLQKRIFQSSPMESIQQHIFEVISTGCQSEDQSVRKNAFYILKQHMQLMHEFNQSNEAFSYYIAVVNAIEQNQSHLMCPAMNMLPKIEAMELKWQKLLFRCILRTQNRQIICPALKYMVTRKDFGEIITDVLLLAFTALNQVTIHREEREISAMFCTKTFNWNWRVSIEILADISWLAFPLYSILTYIVADCETLHSKPNEDNRCGLAFRNIVTNIFNLQTDHCTKRDILAVLLLFMKRIEKDLAKEDKEIIVKKIRELTSLDGEILKLCRDSLNSDASITTDRDVLNDFGGDLFALLQCAKEVSEKDLIHFARTKLDDVKIDEEKALKVLKEYPKVSCKEKLILLLILKSSDNLKRDREFSETFISCNFGYTLRDNDASDDFNSLCTKFLLEEMLQMIEMNSIVLPGELILSHIAKRLEYEQDYSNTFYLFNFLSNVSLAAEKRETAERLLAISYNEMMSQKGKSQFASLCGAFIASFPTNCISMEETMAKLLVDTCLNSAQITEACATQLSAFSNELLAELLCVREGAEMSFIRKNSPLRNLQFHIIDHAVACGKNEDVLNLLVTKYVQLSRTKVMYYPNSHHHLNKLRIIQGIAAIVHQTRMWRKEFLSCLLMEANQPSILYILELIVAETLPTEELNHLIAMLDAPKDLKMHSAQSIFCILYILCKRKKCSEFSRKCYSAILPWTMGQNFSCRLYAQIAILKIYPFIDDAQKDEQQIHQSIEFSFKHLSGNPEKNIERLREDIRFNCLNISSLLSPTYIFRDIPRITGVAESEIVPHCCGDGNLEFATHPWQEKHSAGLQCVQEIYDNIQTKIVPPEGFIHQEEKKSSGLIICASLIENFPNLGGLARTCEIFGVERLTLNSLRDTENTQFRALSMSAEKWLTLEEVKKWQVVAFCKEMKQQGYTIVGAEQTSKSTELSEVVFPEKTLLVLGHEKEGLPADVIATLDFAVEIPQVGRLRSLNVHVTGSIFIYQYAMQHLFQPKS